MLFNLWCRLIGILSLPIVLREYLHADVGREYGVGLTTKLSLLRKMKRNTSKIQTASSSREHAIMAAQIFRVPPSVDGCVVECGSFKGGSAANLSLACALAHRSLVLFDSFEGLPEPSRVDEKHILLAPREFHTYTKGEFCGKLAEVQHNISRCGELGVCTFHPGYFRATLPSFTQRCVLVFIDVDLADSLKDCLLHLWPLLQDNCYLFTHEANHKEIAALFFDEDWWEANLGCPAPGLVGAGTGLPLLAGANGFQSCLGYTIKNPSPAQFRIEAQSGTHDCIIT